LNLVAFEKAPSVQRFAATRAKQHGEINEGLNPPNLACGWHQVFAALRR